MNDYITTTKQSTTKPCAYLLGYTVSSREADIIYRKVSNISRTLVRNKNVDHSDVVGASPVGAAPTTSSFST